MPNGANQNKISPKAGVNDNLKKKKKKFISQRFILTYKFWREKERERQRERERDRERDRDRERERERER
jgi:hypothetical protein